MNARRILFALGTRRETLVVSGARPRSGWRELLQAEHRQQLPEHFTYRCEDARGARGAWWGTRHRSSWRPV